VWDPISCSGPLPIVVSFGGQAPHAILSFSGPLPIVLSFDGQALRAAIRSFRNSLRSSSPSGTPSDPPLLRWPGNYDFCKTRKSHLQQAVLTITKTRDPKQKNVELKSLQNMFLKKCRGKIYVCWLFLPRACNLNKMGSYTSVHLVISTNSKWLLISHSLNWTHA